MSSLDILTIRQYAFVVRLDIHHFCSSSLSTNILGIGINYQHRNLPWCCINLLNENIVKKHKKACNLS
ncbi:MAG: hypothetical protein J6A57_06865 [Ruminococcus sp.]|nr:hypothetical protein [Ruminococcus sp.]